MMRVLVWALTGAMLLPAGAIAQDDAWPTVDEVRLELQEIGYVFAFVADNGLMWQGSRDLKQPIFLSGITLRYDTGTFYGTVTSVTKSDFKIGWPRSTAASDLVELLSRTPADSETILAVVGAIRGGQDGCQEYPVDGGLIAVFNTGPKKDPFYDVFAVEAALGICPDS